MSGYLQPEQQRALDPDVRFGERNGKYYPDQFFDVSQQFMPPTIRELFKWCTFYFYNSPLIGSTIRKISRYPITDLIIEDSSEKIRNVWDNIFNEHIKIKKRLLEVNLDHYTYGNAFVSLHLPFTRFLVCPNCKHSDGIKNWQWRWGNGGQGKDTNGFIGTCKKCAHNGPVGVRDVPYKDFKKMNVVRWSPTNMVIKYNDYTGKRIYLYKVPRKLVNLINKGDRDILEDIPLIVLKAVKNNRLIRFNEDSIFHLKMPSLAEQDQGWGKPLIIHVLKDMFYLYTLRRAQEAIALEHIVPFDIIYPMANANIDPYQHVNLGSWKSQIEHAIKKHRDDPNFKAVFPIPIGLQRMGGDGKVLMLTPELNYLNQTIVGGMGIPQEFLFGGLNWTGSSVSLRTLENDFIQNRSDMLDLVKWMKNKIRAWFDIPDCHDIRFTDFRMADDIQKNQQLIGLNAQFKVSDKTMLTELGYDWEEEQKKMIEEVYFQNYLNDLRAKGNAKTQGEASLISYNYQNKVQELAQKAEANARKRVLEFTYGKPNELPSELPQNQFGGQEETSGMAGEETPGGEQMPDGGHEGAAMEGGQEAVEGAQRQVAPEAGEMATDPMAAFENRITNMATQLLKMEPHQAQAAIQELSRKHSEIGMAVNKKYNEMASGVRQDGQSTGQAGGSNEEGGINMNPLPEKAAPRRSGAV